MPPALPGNSTAAQKVLSNFLYALYRLAPTVLPARKSFRVLLRLWYTAYKEASHGKKKPAKKKPALKDLKAKKAAKVKGGAAPRQVALDISAKLLRPAAGSAARSLFLPPGLAADPGPQQRAGGPRRSVLAVQACQQGPLFSALRRSRVPHLRVRPQHGPPPP